MTPSGIEPATFRFVAQHLNHCATAVPIPIRYYGTQNRPYVPDFTHTSTVRLTATATYFHAPGQRGEQETWRHKTTPINSLTIPATSIRPFRLQCGTVPSAAGHVGARWDITNCDRQYTDRPSSHSGPTLPYRCAKASFRVDTTKTDHELDTSRTESGMALTAV